MTTILAFGTFDRFHGGHIFFLEEAKKLGDVLVVAVARDKHVQELKQKSTFNNEKVRQKNIAKQAMVDQSILSDKELHGWKILSVVKPDIVAIGHDQHGLEKSLQDFFSVNPEMAVPLIRIAKQN